MKIKRIVLALSAVALVAILSPSEAQAGDKKDRKNKKHRHDCHEQVDNRRYQREYRQEYYGRERRPERFERAPVFFAPPPPPPLFQIGFGFDGGRGRNGCR